MSESNKHCAEAVLDCSASEISFLRYVYQDKCVFCQSQEGQRKVLRCLHVACKPCIAEHLSGQNAVTCVRCHKATPDPGPGRRLVDSLADWPEFGSTGSHSPASAAESALKCQHSDDDDEPPFSKCGECDLHLCKSHSAIHRLGRRTRNHALTRLQSSNQNCRLHPTDQLESVCETCDILLCAVCVATTGHEDHTVSSAAEYTHVVSERLGEQQGQITNESTRHAEEEEEIDSEEEVVMDAARVMSENISGRF